jgi:hypothetical protein
MMLSTASIALNDLMEIITQPAHACVPRLFAAQGIYIIFHYQHLPGIARFICFTDDSPGRLAA